MSRAFILIKRERRKTARIVNGEDQSGPREVPVRYPAEKPAEPPVVATSMKAITFLVGYTTALVVVVAFVFRFLVAAEITTLRLELAEKYVEKGGAVIGETYRQEQARQDDRITRMEEEVRRIREQQDKNTGRLDRLEGNGKR